jgi:hypothetical protein
MRYVILEGKRYAMRDIHKLYKEQRDAERRKVQLTLFEMHHDVRPDTQTNGDGRYQQPLLFETK